MIFLVAVVLVIFIVTASFSINVAWMQMVDTELRCATDCSARAGGEALARGMTMEEAAEEVKQIAALNLVDGQGLVIRDADITFGHAATRGGERYTFTPYTGSSTLNANAVRVGGHRVDEAGSSSLSLPFTAFLERTTFQASKYATAAIQERDIALVVDRSGSMGRRDAGRHPDTNEEMTRMQALKLSVQIFRQVIAETDGNEKLALASYASTSRVDTELSHSYVSFDTKVAELPNSGRTNIGAGIDDGVDLVLDGEKARPAATPVLVVMTDGRHNENRDPENAARDAMTRDPRLQIYTVTFSGGADTNRMERVANIGNGVHYHADDFGQLSSVFEEIARTAGAILIE